MAKRFRKQISRAVKRRFQLYEQTLSAIAFRNNASCRADLTLSYNEFVDKARGVLKRIAIVACAFILFIGVLALASCNVTRRVTTESSYFTKGDTAITITTRTVESYDATKKVN